jgi:hypothetical protein
MTLVSKRDRQVDLGALLLIVAGAAIYLFAALQLHDISLYSKTNPGPPGALDAADQARHLSYAGVVILTIGCCVGIAAAILHQRRRAIA